MIQRISFYLLAVCLWLLMPALLLAQDTAPVTPEPLSLAQKVVTIAALVVAVIQGIKKLLPGVIQGNLARVLAIVASVAGIYAIAPPDQVLSVTFLLQALATVVGSLGLHAITRPVG